MKRPLQITGMWGTAECQFYKLGKEIKSDEKDYLQCRKICPYNQQISLEYKGKQTTVCKTGGIVGKIIGKISKGKEVIFQRKVNSISIEELDVLQNIPENKRYPYAVR